MNKGQVVLVTKMRRQ